MVVWDDTGCRAAARAPDNVGLAFSSSALRCGNVASWRSITWLGDGVIYEPPKPYAIQEWMKGLGNRFDADQWVRDFQEVGATYMNCGRLPIQTRPDCADDSDQQQEEIEESEQAAADKTDPGMRSAANSRVLTHAAQSL